MSLSKELATYFEPFSNIRMHNKAEIDKMPKVKHDVISIDDVMVRDAG